MAKLSLTMVDHNFIFLFTTCANNLTISHFKSHNHLYVKLRIKIKQALLANN